MGKLRDLLKAEGDRYRSEKAKRQQVLKEWLDQLESMFAQIDAWLKASDPDGLLDVVAETGTINDPALGEYKAPMRRITLGEKSVEIIPRARFVMASIKPPGEPPVRAQGLVDIRSVGGTDYNLYLSPGGRWYIRDVFHDPEDDSDDEPLHAEQFEAALARLLQ
jgi:hypothetical protein